jgi:hypothetical protein
VAKLSVSSLVFDYILTGPISVVSAGQYLGALLNEISGCCTKASASTRILFAAGLRRLVTIYFWWRTSRACTNRAARRCASCRSPP